MMLDMTTVNKLNEMHMTAMARTFTEQLSNPQYSEMSFEERFGLLLGTGSPLLFQIRSERYEKGSLIITTNLDFSRWGEVFGDNALTIALLDRLTHHAHVLPFVGESYRFKESRGKRNNNTLITIKPPQGGQLFGCQGGQLFD